MQDMDVVRSHAAEILFRTMTDEDQRRIMGWSARLMNWKPGKPLPKKCTRIDLGAMRGKTIYVWKPAGNWTLFFQVHDDRIEIVDIASRDTLRKFAEAS
jgi:hypothetical protein